MQEIVIGQKNYTLKGVITTKVRYKNGYYTIIRLLEEINGKLNEGAVQTVEEITLSPNEIVELSQFIEHINETEPKQCCGL